jgi:hypothetical protein
MGPNSATLYATRAMFILFKEVSLAQLAMGVDVQPMHPGANPCGCEFGFLIFIKKLAVGISPTIFLSKKMFILFNLTVIFYVFDRISNEFQLDQFLH